MIFLEIQMFIDFLTIKLIDSVVKSFYSNNTRRFSCEIFMQAQQRASIFRCFLHITLKWLAWRDMGLSTSGFPVSSICPML
jgi:hypothetical protein